MKGKFENSKDGAKALAEHLLQCYEKDGLDKYEIENGLSTIFLAGAPGSGKTEFLETVLNTEKFLVIDIDKYRSYFSGYNGSNADLYQDSSSRVATRIFDYCIKNNLKVIFDGTLTSEIGVKNIKKSIEKNRKIGIVLIYQDPAISYSYTIIRQDKNERKVCLDVFIKIYYNSIKYCFEVIEKYKNIQFIVGSKNKNRKWLQLSFTSKHKFDKYFKVEYNPVTLKEKLLKLTDKEINEKNILELIKGLWKKD